MDEAQHNPHEPFTTFLKEYLERLIQELDKRVDQRISDQEKRVFQRFDLVEIALNKADLALSDRLRGMNEFRDALRDQSSKMATRNELERLDVAVQAIQRTGITRTELSRVEETVNELRRTKANLDGRLAIVAAAISLAVGIVFRLLIK